MNSTFRSGRERRAASAVDAARKIHIGDQEIDAFIRLQDFESFDAVAGFERVVAEFLQHICDEHAQSRLIVDDQ
jgi:hypothetical protein